MSQSLINKIREVEESTQIWTDRIRLYREVFEEWRQRNSVVDAAIEGRTTVYKEFMKYFEKFHEKGGQRLILPNRIDFGEEELKKIRELEDVVGESVPSNYDSLIRNPLSEGLIIGGTGAMYGASLALYRLIKHKNEPIDRKEFVKAHVPFFAMFGGFFGVLDGLVSWVDKEYGIHQGKENAKYVDSKIQEVYKI